ncbi:MAG: hypothetical protein U0414_17475 [Polyangiaceae bacterium]
MIGRLLLGLLKGIVIGGLLGFGLAKAFPGSMVAPGMVAQILLGAASGVLVGLVAGKPIWAKDAKIEAGMKAAVGAVLGAALIFAARKWLTVPFPVAITGLTQKIDAAQNGTLGGLSLTSFAIVAGILGAFYDADNTPSADKDQAGAAKAESPKTRVATQSPAIDLDELDEEASADKKAKK